MAVTTTPVCVDLSIELTFGGLRGTAAEYSPTLQHYGSYGPFHYWAREQLFASEAEGMALAPRRVGIRRYALPASAHVRGDERIFLELMSATKYSAIPSIDAVQSKSKTRSVPSGRAELALADLVTAALAAEAVRTPLADGALQRAVFNTLLREQPEMLGAAPGAVSDERLQGLEQTSFVRATKALATVRATLAPDTPATRMLAKTYLARHAAAIAASGQDGAALVYGTPAFARAMNAALTYSIDRYMPFAGSNQPTPVRWPIAPGKEREFAGLDLFMYNSNLGNYIPAQYFALYRALGESGPYALDAKSALHRERSLASTLARMNMSPARFISALSAQMSEANVNAAAPSEAFVRACEVVFADALFFATSADYSADYRVTGAAAEPADSAASVQRTSSARMRAVLADPGVQALLRRCSAFARRAATTAVMLGQTHGRNAHRRVQAARQLNVHNPLVALHWAATSEGSGAPGDKSDGKGGFAAAYAGIVDVESFDDAIITGQRSVGDCEDASFVTLAYLLDTQTLSARAVPATTPLLAAARHVFDVYELAGNAVPVTAALPQAKDKVADLDAPVIIKGSATDEACDIGGHVHPSGLPKALLLPYLDNGLRQSGLTNAGDNDFRWVLDGRPVRAWERALPKFTGEGTTMPRLRLLPAGEYSAAYAAEQATTQAFVQYLAARAKQSGLDLAALSPEASPLHVQPQAPNVRESTFYRSEIHMVFPRLFERDPRLGQLLLVDTTTQTRGADFGDYLRDKGARYALVSHLGTESRDAVRAVFDPVHRAVMRVQPANVVGRFPEAPAFLQATRAAVPLSVCLDDQRLPQQVRADQLLPPSTLAPLDLALARSGHLLGSDALVALGSFKQRPLSVLGEALDRHARGAATQLAARRAGVPERFSATGAAAAASTVPVFDAAAHVDRDDRAMVRLYTGAYAFQDAAFGAALVDLLHSMQREGLIEGHVVWHDRPLAHGDDRVTLGVVVKHSMAEQLRASAAEMRAALAKK